MFLQLLFILCSCFSVHFFSLLKFALIACFKSECKVKESGKKININNYACDALVWLEKRLDIWQGKDFLIFYLKNVILK